MKNYNVEKLMAEIYTKHHFKIMQQSIERVEKSFSNGGAAIDQGLNS
jgi:hypothetical protein